VVDRHDLARDIRLNTGIDAAVFDQGRGVWTVTTEHGEALTARYLVTALGPLSTANLPDIRGLDTFRGRTAHTGAWPADLSLQGKRVGVIGTGSTGTQLIGAAADQAVHLTVFQRTPQYVVPSGDGPLARGALEDYRARYDKIWQQVRQSRVGCGFVESDVPAMSVSAAERVRVFERNWRLGNGFRFMFGTFGDIAFDPAANEAAAEFIRAKIRQIVRDPETARKLQPADYYARRPICNSDYYETYNRDDVTLVSITENPIREVTPAGVLTEDGVEHELDVLAFATGFDAVDGSYRRIDLRGRGGETIQQHWKDGPTSYLGMAVPGFPNMFMVYGPNSVFTNLPPGIETQVEWIASLIGAAEQHGRRFVEAVPDAERDWTAACRQIADASLFAKTRSWIFGANVPGKTNTVMFYFGGLKAYREKLDDIVRNGYDGFVLADEPMPAATQP
jgi:cation diffusion facilitator CzcD-associated flavoprotein CzcO